MSEPGIDRVSELDSPSPVLQESPGARLRAAREAAGLTLSEVAQILKFSPRQIEALERDDYRILPGATFVRGFVRAYAKLLKLDAMALLSLLDDAAPASEAEIVPPENMGDADTSSFIERNQRWLIAGLLLMVLAVVAAYLYTRMEGPVGGKQAPAAAALPVPLAPPAQPAAEPLGAAVVPAAPTPALPASSESAGAPGINGVGVMPAPATALPVNPLPGTPQASNPPPLLSAPAVANAQTLMFDFDAVSWLEVKDASQRIVLTGEFPRGSRQVVNGRPPYQLWIGKASGVRVTYGERKVDLQPYTRDAVARLTLD